MLKNPGVNRLLWLFTGLLTLFAALAGVINPGVYDRVVGEDILPGVVTQDIVAILAAVTLLYLALTTKAASYRKQIIALGLLGFVAYAYGIYTIEQVYNSFYLVYMALLGLSVYAFVYGLMNIDREVVSRLALPGPLRVAAAVYGFIIAGMFNFLWISMLIPLLQAGDRIENLFSIFIIDLCFIMPGFVLSGIQALRRKPMGLVGIPVLYVLGVGILSPLALGEALRPVMFNLPYRPGEFWLYFVLSAVFLVFAAVYLGYLRAREIRPKSA